MKGKFIERLIKLNGPFIARTLREVARQVEHAAPGPPRVAVILFRQGRELTVGEKIVSDEVASVPATASFFDAKGASAMPDGIPAWTSSDESVAMVSASEDGLSADIAVGLPGFANIEVRSQETDNETGEPYELVAQGTLTVTAGDAVIGSVDFA